VYFELKCECGKIVNVEAIDYNIKLPETKDENLLAQVKCTNPECKKTLFVRAKLTLDCSDVDDRINTRVDWETIRLGSTVYIDSAPYEVAMKVIRKIQTDNGLEVPLKVLYLRTVGGIYNIVGEVMGNGEILVLWGDEEPLTPAGYESWTEDGLMAKCAEMRR